MISILIVDDHPMVREGLAAMLTSERLFSVAAPVGNGEAAVAACRKAKPDVILCDIRMPGMDGFETLAKLKRFHPDVNVLLMAGMPLKAEETRARAEGARGYLPKSVNLKLLVAAIKSIAAGVDGFVCEEFQSAPSALTARELDVLRELSSGKTREQVAAALAVGAESVKTHMKSILVKLDCPNATAAVSKAYELGILRV